MNRYYLLLIVAFIIGQIVHTIAMVAKLQSGKDITFQQAFEIYTESESRNYFFALALLLCLLFILSEFVDIKTDHDISMIKAKAMKSYYDYILIYYKTISLVIGVFASHIFYLLYGKGKAAIERYITNKTNQIN